MPFEVTGRKEVVEAVLTAALTTAATELVTWALQRWKDRQPKPAEAPECSCCRPREG